MTERDYESEMFPEDDFDDVEPLDDELDELDDLIEDDDWFDEDEDLDEFDWDE